MDYYRYQFDVNAEWKEMLLAFLSTLPFESFEETDDGIDAYLPVDDMLTAGLERDLAALSLPFSLSFSRALVPDQNWNALWEAGFQPIRVGSCCGVRADFHPPLQGVAHEIIINPKMAFGTGHHDTTFLMIGQICPLDLQGAKVLDYGCGTGILAILAAKKGANIIEAVDNDYAAYENALENNRVNQADHIRVWHGTLDIIQGEAFDCILANINRNVILDSLPALYQKLNRRGVLLISGLLRKDEAAVLTIAGEQGFSIDEKHYRNDWCCFKLQK